MRDLFFLLIDGLDFDRSLIVNVYECQGARKGGRRREGFIFKYDLI